MEKVVTFLEYLGLYTGSLKHFKVYLNMQTTNTKNKPLRVARTVMPDNRPGFNEVMLLHQQELKALYKKLYQEENETKGN